eukprot:scaffold139919_cov19-Tisochrysis_lutea.AAC.1
MERCSTNRALLNHQDAILRLRQVKKSKSPCSSLNIRPAGPCLTAAVLLAWGTVLGPCQWGHWSFP